MQHDHVDSEPAAEVNGFERRTYLAEPFTISARLHHALELAFGMHADNAEFRREWSRTSGFSDRSSFSLVSMMVESVWLNREWLWRELKPGDEEAIELAVALVRMVGRAVERIAEARDEGLP